MSELRVVSVQIRDVLGAREFAMRPGRVTLVKGRNASGKSTALQAVQAALGGGNLRKLARVDPEGKDTEPEVVLVLEGPGAEAYRVERKGEKLRIRQRVGNTAAFEDLNRPQGWLSSLFDPAGANPVAFLAAKDEQRATLLLEALPLQFDRAALLRQMGIGETELPPIPRGLHPLEEVALIRQAVFTTRTGVNRDHDGKAKTADQIRRTLPAVLPEAVDLGALEQERRAIAVEIAQAEERAKAAEDQALAAARAAHEAATGQITSIFRAEAAKRRAAHEQEAARLRAEVEARIATMKTALEAGIEGLREKDEGALGEADAALEGAQETARAARETAQREISAMRERLTTADGQLAELRAQAEAATKARGQQDIAEQMDREAEELQAESDRLTVAIETLDAFRRRMAEHLPIEGLAIDGKTITVNGIPYEQLNTQQRIQIAVQVACLRAKGSRLPVVFVDGAEALDSEHFDLLVAELKRQGTQAFVARVTDEPLTVEDEDGRPAA